MTMTEKSDEQVLAEAMGRCWHDDPSVMICGKCGEAEPSNPSPTDEAFCWRTLQYMMQREDWPLLYWSNAETRPDLTHDQFIKWLLDPARFIGLCDEWCSKNL